jgi:hypothetical protein
LLGRDSVKQYLKGVIAMKIRRPGRCPRCGGNLFLDRDWSGWYEECLQCSFSRRVERIAVHEKATVQVVKEQRV